MRTLEAAHKILQEGIADIILVGDKQTIIKKADGLDLTGAKFVDPYDCDKLNDYVVFLISGAAILSLKELSEAADSKEKYRILRRIGVDEKKIRHSLLAQSGVFFAMPLLLAIVHSVFGMQTAMFILTAFGRGGLLGSILLAAAVILVIYGIYFMITYICSRKIISE